MPICQRFTGKIEACLKFHEGSASRSAIERCFRENMVKLGKDGLSKLIHDRRIEQYNKRANPEYLDGPIHVLYREVRRTKGANLRFEICHDEPDTWKLRSRLEFMGREGKTSQTFVYPGTVKNKNHSVNLALAWMQGWLQAGDHIRWMEDIRRRQEREEE